MDLPARHSSVRELLAIQGLLQFLAEVDTRQVLDAVDEQVVDSVVRGWDRRLVERLSKCPPEVGITAEAPLLGLRSEQGPHLHDVRLRDVAAGARNPVAAEPVDAATPCVRDGIRDEWLRPTTTTRVRAREGGWVFVFGHRQAVPVAGRHRANPLVPLFTAEESSQRCRGACALHCVSTWASPIRRSTDCSRGSRLMVPD